MQDDFDLATVLTITTGINCVDNFNKVMDLYCFMFEDDLLTPMAVKKLNIIARNHIFRIHPELKNVTHGVVINIKEWLAKQEEMYGDTLTISVVGENVVKLEKQPYASAR